MEEKSFGERLKALRERKGLSQLKLADASDLSLSAISLLELGIRKNPRESTIKKLAQGLGISISELMGEDSSVPVQITLDVAEFARLSPETRGLLLREILPAIDRYRAVKEPPEKGKKGQGVNGE